jgi:hypothetical protein
MPSDVVVALVTVVVLLGLVAWFDARCLADLRATSDRELRHFDRRTWAFIIVLSFPIGPMAYLLYAKGPRRFI